MLVFYYGVMGSSKTAQALMTRHNYMTKGYNVLLFKPKADTRCIVDGKALVNSRLGLSAPCIEFLPTDHFNKICLQEDISHKKSIIIVDEAQFLKAFQVDELKNLGKTTNVLCFGLLTNFKTELFEGSKRLVEIADYLKEITSVCKCGEKASVNARIVNGKITLCGQEILVGGDESYESMCYNCFEKRRLLDALSLKQR